MVGSELEDKRTSLLGLLALFGAEGESWEVHGYVWVWVCVGVLGVCLGVSVWVGGVFGCVCWVCVCV